MPPSDISPLWLRLLIVGLALVSSSVPMLLEQSSLPRYAVRYLVFYVGSILAASVGISVAWSIDPSSLRGLFIVVVIIGPLGWLASRIYDRLHKTLNWLLVIHTVAFMAPAISTLLSVTTLIFVEPVHTGYAATLRRLSSASVEESLARIQSTVTTFREEVEIEAKRLEEAGRIIVAEIENKNKELADLGERLSEMMAEADYYRRLSAITEEEALALREALRSNPVLDFLLGLVAGVVSSALVAVIMTRSRWVKGHAPADGA